MPILAVNVDHVATIRQARLGREPDPVTAAMLAELAGAKGIIVHLREDRRHVQDRDVELLRQTVQTKFNLEMAATQEMQGIALRVKPDSVCLVPEKRQELTTEGGLDCLERVDELQEYLKPIRDAGILVSLFIDPDPKQIDAAAAIGPEYVELHTGAYAEAWADNATGADEAHELSRLLTSIRLARKAGLKVNLGHGLNYANIMPFKNIPGISEYSIGHSIVSKAVLVGMERAVTDMVALVERFAGEES